MRKLILKLPLIALLTLSLSEVAQASVGRVLFAFGDVSVERPAPDVLTKGMPVDNGEIVVTGGNGYVQLLLDDNTKVAVRPNSRFRIDAVESPAEGGFPAVGQGVTPRAQFTLQRGGFRTLTGRIASAHPSTYRISTPNATIGVRGTLYSVVLVQPQPAVPIFTGGTTGGSGTTSSADVPGLYVGVSDGIVNLFNNAGELDLSRQMFGFVADPQTPPVRLLEPPAVLADDGLTVLIEEAEEAEEAESETAQAESGDESEEGDAEEAASEFGGGDAEVAESGVDAGGDGAVADTGPDQEISAVSGDGASIDLTDGGATASVLFAFSSDAFAIGTRAAAASIVLDDDGFLTGFQALGESGVVETFDIGSAIPHNNGFDPETELRWGRWSEGIASVGGVDLDLGATSLHYVLAVEQDLPSQVITGSAEYVLVGNTDPTDNLGNVGVLGSASLFANFTESIVDSNVQLGINGQVWQASGTGEISSNLFSGLYNSVTVGGSAIGTGSFGGLFTSFGDDGLPFGAGMTYNLTNGSTTVNGAAVFNQAR